MKFTTALTLGVLATASYAATVADLPTCAQTCAINALSTSTCTASDTACLCADKAYSSSLSGCVAGGCSTADQAKTLTVTKELCAAKSSGSSSSSSSSSSASAKTASSTAKASASPVLLAASTGTGHPNVAATNGTGYAGQGKPTQFTGGADALKAGQWMGFFALVGLFAL